MPPTLHTSIPSGVTAINGVADPVWKGDTMKKRNSLRSRWLSNTVIVFCILGQKANAFAVASICFTWASVFYFCQYFIAKRPKPVLIGAVLEGIAALIMIISFILVNLGVIQ